MLNIILIPLLDIAVIVLVIVAAKNIWGQYYFGDPGHFEKVFDQVNLPLYASIMFLGLVLAGGYNTIVKSFRQVLGGVAIGTLALLVVYALLPEHLRSSRAVILIVAPLLLASLSVLNLALRSLRGRVGRRRIVVVGGDGSVTKVMEMINRIHPDSIIVGAVSAKSVFDEKLFLTDASRLPDVVEEYGVDEIIFSASDVQFNDISKWMSELGPVVTYRIAGEKSADIIGSDSKKATGKLYTSRIEFSIDNKLGRRSKRMIDVLYSIVMLIFGVFKLVFWREDKVLSQAWRVLKGKYSWISYDPRDSRLSELPRIKPGFLNPSGASNGIEPVGDELHTINYIYAREYSLWKDLEILLKS